MVKRPRFVCQRGLLQKHRVAVRRFLRMTENSGTHSWTIASLFSHSNNTRIKDSAIITITNTLTFIVGEHVSAVLAVLLGVLCLLVGRHVLSENQDPQSLDALHRLVAPNAILNAGGRADEVRCHPGTREEVIGLIERSMDPVWNGSTPRMLWLSGPAGAGKSAIMQTLAERCDKRGVPHANFFFFRADSSRSDATALVPTLLHQIIQLYPSAGKIVAAALASNPLLFQMGLPEQFEMLMRLPTTGFRHSLSKHRPIVLLIDGLDECETTTNRAQEQILHALDTLLSRKGEFFRVVVTSRVEPQIEMTFKHLRSQVDSIFLDDRYLPEKDIRLVVIAEFDSIKSSHSLAHTLPADWPSDSDIDGIVKKSSGQFIFAATVMRFIAFSSASPILSLRKVQGIIPPVKNSPFAYIDAIYTYILDQVEDTGAVLSFLSSVLMA